MIGYMEAITDPSYSGQILTFSYPLVGNYGATFIWGESSKIHPKAIVVSELSQEPTHRHMESSLDTVLERQKVGGISGIDTRALIKLIREKGTIPAVVSVYENSNRDLVKEVTTKETYILNPEGKFSIVLIDYGVKKTIIEELVKRNAKITVVPATTSAIEILQYNPQGIILSNGPGNPAEFAYAQKAIHELLQTNIPLFGICLGHQLLALASGAKTFKLLFGHRGVNQPVFHTQTKKSYLMSQNHSFAVDATTLSDEWLVTFENLNDHTVEGIRHKTKPFLTVQFHPEANPGPHDTKFLFDEFIHML